ncbi:hypothetical protein [Rossellomorea sp. LjRoot5]|uniref:hypothetical protein n=1 Tax=Rossellomorea sp. LjRoot5 TaxID=3342331 RepID=UPI003ECD2727
MMNIQKGQGLKLCLDFADGQECTYPRTFLVLDADQSTSQLSLLNISSIKGKEHKLLFSSNERIILYNPPFYLASFVKLDAQYTIDYFTDLDSTIMAKGKALDPEEFQRIEQRYIDFLTLNEISSVYYEASRVKEFNGIT